MSAFRPQSPAQDSSFAPVPLSVEDQLRQLREMFAELARQQQENHARIQALEVQAKLDAAESDAIWRRLLAPRPHELEPTETGEEDDDDDEEADEEAGEEGSSASSLV